MFLRTTKRNPSGPALVWDSPGVLLARADYYAYDGDHFGCVNPKDHHSMSGLTRDPYKIAKFKQSNNEIMFRHGIDLLGAEAPSRILCGSATERAQVLSVLQAKGITHLGGKPIQEIVT